MELNNKTSRGINKAEEVEPIKNVKDINKVKQYLQGKENKRDYMLFVVGINVGLRASDLLSLRIKDVCDIDEKCNIIIKDSVKIEEQKTSKVRQFELNKSAKESIKMYLGALNEVDVNNYLFKSRKGDSALTVESAHKIIKITLKELNIKGNYGTHSLRITFAYHTYINNIKENPMIVQTLQKILNHSSSGVTLE